LIDTDNKFKECCLNFNSPATSGLQLGDIIYIPSGAIMVRGSEIIELKDPIYAVFYEHDAYHMSGKIIYDSKIYYVFKGYIYPLKQRKKEDE